jgi:two-component system, LytTR family, response regulator
VDNLLNCLIIEDEPLAQELIQKFINRLPFLALVGISENAIDGFDAIKNLKPDIVFMDINMPEMTGIELLSAMGIQKPAIIITTGYPDFAVDSYSFDVTDYLLKPISFDRFLRAISKAQERIDIGRSNGGKATTSMIDKFEGLVPEINNVEIKHIFLKVEKKNIRISFDEIILAEGMKDYIKIHTVTNCFVIHQTMKSMIEILPTSRFLRINRSYIINIDAIRSIEGNQVELINKVKIDIGVTYREEVILKLGI